MVDNLDELLRSPDFAKAIRQVQESVLRKFVAAHPDNYQAWTELLRLLAVNESWRELARLAREAARRFPTEPTLPVLAAVGLTHLCEIGPALATITQAGALLHRFAPAHHLTGDLLLASNPAHAALMFKRLLASNPHDSRSQTGAAERRVSAQWSRRRRSRVPPDSRLAPLDPRRNLRRTHQPGHRVRDVA